MALKPRKRKFSRMEGRTILNLEVNAGLCNRLRAVIAGICWAERTDRTLIIYWPSNREECAAGFHDLFHADSLPYGVTVVDGSVSSPESCLQADDANRIFLKMQNVINIKSHGNFWDGYRSQYLQYLRKFRPSEPVQKLLSTWNLADDTIGVHIRMTDNEKAIRVSPFELFYNKIIELNKPVSVFSDEPRAILILQERFGSRIHAYETIRSRSSLEGMIEATAVLFALASKKQIYGSANSSFSEFAQEYGDSQLIILRKFKKN